MNAKFFDLRQEKQDRMVNAILKFFALHGYLHASTDDMVKEAGISKGLLFHYFDSKLGAYSFAYDYAVRYISLELSSAIDPTETSYFELLRQIEAAKMQVQKSYPYMLLFMKRANREDVTEALLSIESGKEVFENNLRTILDKADKEFIEKDKDAARYLNMMNYTLEGILESSLRDGSFNAEDNYKESIKYINLTEKAII